MNDNSLVLNNMKHVKRKLDVEFKMLAQPAQ